MYLTVSLETIPWKFHAPLVAIVFSVREMLWFWAVNHSSISANQNVTFDSPREKLEERTPCFPHKIKHSNGSRDWLI